MSGRGRGLAQMVSALPDLAPAQDASEEPTVPSGSTVETRLVEPASAPPAQQDTADSPALEGNSSTGESGPETRAVASPSASRRKAPRSSSSARVHSVPADTPPPAQDAQEGPRYLRFEPKTVRLTAGQVDALQAVETKLRRAARGKRRQGDELPSWNMLARLGIDLVLREADRLSGVTEDELRGSLGLDPLEL